MGKCGSMIRFGSKSLKVMETRGEVLIDMSSESPNLTGQVEQTVWHDIVVALSKDIPEASKLAQQRV